MTRVASWLVAAAVAVPAALLAQQPPPVFRTNTDVVSVDVSVRASGHSVPALTASDFEVRDNGVVQKIEASSLETLPVDVTLLLDASRSVQGTLLQRLKVSVLDTAGLLGPSDAIRLLALQQRILQIFPFQPGGIRPPVEGLAAQGGTSLFDGLVAALMHRSQPDHRQLVIVYTDGQDTLSIIDADAAKDVAARADAVVHFVVPVEATRTRQIAPNSAHAIMLKELAGGTGGQVFYSNAAEPISDVFKRALSEFRASYVLRYEPSGVKREGWHDITVKVLSPGQYEVRAKKGYSAS